MVINVSYYKVCKVMDIYPATEMFDELYTCISLRLLIYFIFYFGPPLLLYGLYGILLLFNFIYTYKKA